MQMMTVVAGVELEEGEEMLRLALGLLMMLYLVQNRVCVFQILDMGHMVQETQLGVEDRLAVVVGGELGEVGAGRFEEWGGE